MCAPKESVRKCDKTGFVKVSASDLHTISIEQENSSGVIVNGLLPKGYKRARKVVFPYTRGALCREYVMLGDVFGERVKQKTTWVW